MCGTRSSFLPATNTSGRITRRTRWGLAPRTRAVISCAGTLNEGSFYVDYHFTPRFDAFAGIAYSWVTGGLAIAIPHKPGVPYFSTNNSAPLVGVRFRF